MRDIPALRPLAAALFAGGFLDLQRYRNLIGHRGLCPGRPMSE